MRYASIFFNMIKVYYMSFVVTDLTSQPENIDHKVIVNGTLQVNNMNIYDEMSSMKNTVGQIAQFLTDHWEDYKDEIAENNRVIEEMINQKVQQIVNEKFNLLQTTIDSINQRVQQNTSNYQSINTKVTNAEQTIGTLTTNLTAAGAAIHDVKQQANALQSASTDQFRQIRQAMDETRSNINTLTTSVNSFSSSINTIQADLTATKTKLSDAKTEIGNNQVAITSIRNSIDDIRTNLNSTIREYNTLYSQVQSISTNVDGLSTRVRTLESNSSNISTIQNNINLLRQVCSSLKSQYIIKSWVPSVQTDNNGFLRLNMSQFPSDMQSKSNDYIVTVEPYDVRASEWETVIPQWTDWNGDQGINVRLTWHNNGSVGAGRSVKIFYWATNPAAALPLPS